MALATHVGVYAEVIAVLAFALAEATAVGAGKMIIT